MQRRAGLTIIFTAGEENACDGAAYLAGFPDALGRAGAIVVGEPTANAPWIAHKGCVRYAIGVDGVGAHASMPKKGVNATYRAAAAIEKLASLDFDLPPHPFLGDQTFGRNDDACGNGDQYDS